MRPTTLLLALLLLAPAALRAQTASFAEAPKVKPDAAEVYARAAALADHREDEPALALLRPLAEAGYARAGLLLGKMHANGWGVPASRAEGLAWVRHTAAAADPDGQASLAMRFLFEDDFPGYDAAEALHWFRASAERGSARGAFGLGLLYKHGRGVARDEARAAHWFRRAAAAGFAPAELMLGTLHDAPSGALHDPGEAERRYRLAASGGGGELLEAWAEAYAEGAARGYPVPTDPAEAARLRRRASLHASAQASVARPSPGRDP